MELMTNMKLAKLAKYEKSPKITTCLSYILQTFFSQKLTLAFIPTDSSL